MKSLNSTQLLIQNSIFRLGFFELPIYINKLNLLELFSSNWFYILRKYKCSSNDQVNSRHGQFDVMMLSRQILRLCVFNQDVNCKNALSLYL